MDNLIAIELTNDEQYEIIKPFLTITTSLVEKFGLLYIFSSPEDVQLLEKELAEFKIIEDIHPLRLLQDPILYENFHDYGFSSGVGHYLYANMIASFAITTGDPIDIEMALLQFHEHLIACSNNIYYVDWHHRALIEKIANSYNVKINFFELDK
ncbi:hypothetical protein JOC85_001626 [Bacillus mesophilus]|uniref:Uncharacterized protein n=1 Tax=Bacillus mesophilus TaxID=1808955 RepID=A0A6M0Q7X6_9BACI|nr:hypothetical protein [Bacillus mesophilus]MBM7660854.1 hypothetical protein [Bacillus mesophilus]NEY71600.1 hypothetical protein [Bacillus mesophilus]